MPQGNRGAAIGRIRDLAAAGRVRISRNAQTDVESLEYDFHDVCECLSLLTVGACDGDEESAIRPGVRVYIFEEFDFNGDRLYIKVALNPDEVYVLSFKLSGSPG